MHKRDLIAIGSWVGLTVCLWIIAWIIAEAIPVFSSLLTLIVCHSQLFSNPLGGINTRQTALFGSWFTFGFTGIFWLHMNKGLWFSSPKKIALTFLNTFAIAVGIVLVSSVDELSSKSLTLIRTLVRPWSLYLRKIHP